MAVNINGQVFLKLKLGDLEINNNIFKKLVILQEADFVIPTFELTLLMFDMSLISFLSETNIPLKIGIGTNETNVKTYKIRILNYDVIRENSRFNFKISGIFDFKDFINNVEIKSYKNLTSDQVLKQFKTVKPIIEYKGNDKQTWIKHNTSEKEFAQKIVQHAFTNNDDLLLASLNIKDTSLRVISIKEALKKEHKFLFDDNFFVPKDKKILFNKMTVNSDNGIWQYILNEGRSLPVFNNITFNLDLYEQNTKSIKNQKNYNKVQKNRNFYTEIDNGNTHKNYFQAFINQFSFKTNLFSKNVYIEIDRYFFDEDKLQVLDTVKLLPNERTKISDTLKGKYILTGKYVYFTPNHFNQRFRLNRDYNLNLNKNKNE